MKKILLASATLLAAGSANAVEMRPYVGLEYTRVMADYNDAAPGVNGDQIVEDGLDGVTPYVGLQFNKYVAVEASYLQTEEGKKSNILGTAVNSEVEMSGYAADVVGTLPITKDEKLSLIGSAGVGHYDVDVTYSAPGSANLNGSSDDTAIRGGIGAQYQITDNVGVRAMARYIDVDFEGEVDHLVTGNVGLSYRF